MNNNLLSIPHYLIVSINKPFEIILLNVNLVSKFRDIELFMADFLNSSFSIYSVYLTEKIKASFKTQSQSGCLLENKNNCIMKDQRSTIKD